jgi:hypothetical protein
MPHGLLRDTGIVIGTPTSILAFAQGWTWMGVAAAAVCTTPSILRLTNELVVTLSDRLMPRLIEFVRAWRGLPAPPVLTTTTTTVTPGAKP